MKFGTIKRHRPSQARWAEPDWGCEKSRSLPDGSSLLVDGLCKWLIYNELPPLLVCTVLHDKCFSFVCVLFVFFYKSWLFPFFSCVCQKKTLPLHPESSTPGLRGWEMSPLGKPNRLTKHPSRGFQDIYLKGVYWRSVLTLWNVAVSN